MTAETVEQAQARYAAALHAMQSGVKGVMQATGVDPHTGAELDTASTGPKHLRVGVNSAFVGQSAIARLLIAKGVITTAEYYSAAADAMEEEKQRYERELSQLLGGPVSLA